METDWKKVDELTLALSNPVTKAKSVVLSDEGVKRSREQFEQLFGASQPS
jgi:hypothetical protein